jgi:hypothetical protein
MSHVSGLQIAIRRRAECNPLERSPERVGSATPACGAASAISRCRAQELPEGEDAIPLPEDFAMDLAIWVPLTVVLGLAALGLMFAFVVACDKV